MKHTHGFIALTSVLIMSAIFLSIAISIASRAISGLDISLALIERDAARYASEACVENALLEMQRSLDYEGNEGILVSEGECQIFFVTGSGNTPRVIETESVKGSHAYRIEAGVDQVSPDTVITSFERAGNF